MGQNSSGLSGNALASPRRKGTTQKPPRPLDPPRIPKPPKHVVPENKVIPNGVSDMEKARKLLRPVSQELTKVHPDFADIFQYDPEIDFLAGGDESSLERSLNVDPSDKENASLGLSNSFGAISNVGNGSSLPTGSASLSNGLLGSKSTGDIAATDSSSNTRAAGGLRRSQSMQRDTNPHPAKYALHKRQASFSNSASGVNQSVIVEDPREHLYNVARDQPFSNVMPSTASLPLENSFGLDYSFNLTYAQLAEYRRQKRTNELEEKTGKKLSDLTAEISANNTVPKSPFDRQAIGTKSGPLSVSTGSSETGVSKSKKKKAPAPPPPQSKVGESSSKVGLEPPVDYDMEDMPPMDFNRRSSSASSNFKKPAPQPLPKRLSVPTLTQPETQFSHRMAIPKTIISPPSQNNNDAFSVSTTGPSNPLPPTPPPAPPVPSVLSQTSSTAVAKTDSKQATSNKNSVLSAVPGHRSVSESVALAKAQLEALKRLEDVLKNPKPVKDVEENSETQANTEEATKQKVNEKDNAYVEEIPDFNENNKNDQPKSGDSDSMQLKPADLHQNADTAKGNTFEPIEKDILPKNKDKKTEGTPTKRMSSLLQHDIVLAAQARGAKVKRSKPPQVLEKPLDPAQVFRQELAKAASAREARRQNRLINGGSSGEDMESRSSNSRSNSRSSTPSSERVLNYSLPTQMKQPEENGLDGNGNFQTGQSQQTSIDAPSPMKQESEMGQDISTSKTELDAEFIAFGKHHKQPSIHSEDMSISSGNSQRVFPSNWVPEDDLDSDDDIKADEFTLGNLSSRSEGFKSSIVPSKMKDLKTGKKEKKRQFMKNKNPNEPSTDRRKLESVRKLKDSVQSSMKQAFGSISRASGKLLKKHKSQDFLESRESDYSLPSPRLGLRMKEDETSNWELASSHDGSLRRSLSDANVMNGQYANGDAASESSSDDDSDVGDIDFSTGMNNIPAGKTNLGNRKTNWDGMRDSRSPGENEPRKEKKLSLTKLFTKKDTSKMHTEDALGREIREKERLLNLERQKQQEMEKSFRRLQDLEAQERLQRIQTANMRHQITMLQQQQMRNAHAELTNSPVGLSGTPSLSSTQIPGPPSSSLVNSGGLMSSSSLGFTPLASMPNPVSGSSLGFPQHQAHHQMDLTKDVFGRNVPMPIMSSTFNASQFTTHSGPIIGGNPVTSNMPNLTSQELGYLSEYMRVMGVQPPATQQQWALLLSTVPLNLPASQSHGFSLHHQPPMHSGEVSIKSNGPDLSKFLGSSGKRLENTLVNGSHQGAPGFMSHSSYPYPIRPFDASISNTNDLGGLQSNSHSSTFITDVLTTTLKQQGISTNSNEVTNLTEKSNIELGQNIMQLNQQRPPPSFETANDSSMALSTAGNGLVHGSESKMETSISSTTPPSSSSPDDSMDLPAAHDDPNRYHGNNNNNNNNNNTIKDTTTDKLTDDVTPVTHPTPSSFPPKVYGPIGFRPVSFSAGAAAT